MQNIKKDSLVIVLDVHNIILGDAIILGVFEWWKLYYVERIRKLVELLNYCNEQNIKIEEKLLYGRRARLLDHIHFEKDVNYNDFSTIYFCGISIDQCVSKEYFRVNHPNKLLIRNCSMQEAEYCLDIDWLLRGLPFRHGKPFNNLEELEKHIDRFLLANEINWIDID